MATLYVSGGELTEPLSDVLSSVSRIDGIDIGLALSRISGKQDVLEDCVEQTAYSTGEHLKKMSVCLSNDDLRGFSIEAHGLKVALAGIGATSCSEYAAKLEMESKTGNAPECKKEFIAFSGLIKRLTAQLKSALPQEKSEKILNGDSALLFKIAKETVDCLSIFETDDALNAMKRLETFTFGDETDALLKHIKSKIKAYKYDEAMLLLGSILTSDGQADLS